MQISRILLLVATLALLVSPPGRATLPGLELTRLEISTPWTGFYYGQGTRLWSKAVVHNGSNTVLRGVKIRFEFFDPVGSRETFDQNLPVVQPGGTIVVESPQWLDYSGAQIGVDVSIYQRDVKHPLAHKVLGVSP